MEETKEEPKKLTIDSWEVDDALRTLIRAREIETNKELMDLVQKKAALQKQVTDELASRADKLFTTMKE
jgi:hypothetical protein